MGLGLKKAISILLLLVLLLDPIVSIKPAHAGLDDALEWLFMTASTEAKAYQSQRRMGFVGGTVMARTPIKSVNIISFAPPKLDAGCGGIDLFMGSFSFINMEQFMQLLRAIAANAVGLAFKAALHAISPSLEAIISKLETLVNNLNRTFRNSCSIAKSLPSLFSGIGSLGDSIKQAASEVADFFRNSTGAVDDFFASVKENFSNPDIVYESGSKPDLNPSVGNLVWKALFLNNVAAYIGNPTLPVGNVLGNDGKLMAMYVMSITGTVINMKDEDQANSECEGGDGGDRCGVIAREYGPTLHFVDLLEGNRGNNKPQYYQCNTTASEMGCTSLTLSLFPFEGTRSYVSRLLFGTPDGYMTGEYTDSSIVGKVISGGELDAQQKAFLESVPMPVLAAMLRVQNEPAAVTAVAYISAPIIAEQLAVSLGRALVKAANLAFAGQYKVDKPSFYDDNVNKFAQEMAPYVKDGSKTIEAVIRLEQYATAVRKSLSPPM